MKGFPHRYVVAARADAEGDVRLESEHLPTLTSAPPAEFGGPGNQWSPETLLAAAVADCFVLTFRAMAQASRLPWTTLTCDVEGVLERLERVTQFTEFRLHAALRVPPGTDEDRARRLLERAEHTCLITNSLKSRTHLQADVETTG